VVGASSIFKKETMRKIILLFIILLFILRGWRKNQHTKKVNAVVAGITYYRKHLLKEQIGD